MTHSSNHYPYSGQDLFIGVDVHKRTYSVAVVLEGELLKKWRTPAVPAQLASQLKRYFPGANLKTVYEAGFSGFVLHRELESAEIESIVVNASSIETTVHNRVKTDKRDALKLATQLAAGRLKGIRVPVGSKSQSGW
ncbi:MAG: transposase [Cyanobacteria bacterium P01_E01_bin.6]